MAQDNVDVIQTAWDAFVRGDIDKATVGRRPQRRVRRAGIRALGRDLPRPGGVPRAAREHRRQLRQVRGQAGEGARRRRRPRRRAGQGSRPGPRAGRTSRARRSGSTRCATARSCAATPTPTPRGCSKRSDSHRRIRLSVVIVSFNSAAALRRSLPPLVEQLGDDDELIVVDNGSSDDSAAVVAELAPAATADRGGRKPRLRRRLQPRRRGRHRRAPGARQPRRRRGAGLRRRDPRARPPKAAAGRRGWGSSPPSSGRVVNTEGGVVHFTGLAWAGGAGARAAGRSPTSRRARSASPPAPAWRSASTRGARRAGCRRASSSTRRTSTSRCGCGSPAGAIGIEPAAQRRPRLRVRQGRGQVAPARAQPLGDGPAHLPGGACSLLLAPALLATELALIAVSVAGGWGRQKLGAVGDGIAALPRVLRERRAIQARRTVSAAEFAAALDRRPLVAVPRARGRARVAALGAARLLVAGAARCSAPRRAQADRR